MKNDKHVKVKFTTEEYEALITLCQLVQKKPENFLREALNHSLRASSSTLQSV